MIYALKHLKHQLNPKLEMFNSFFSDGAMLSAVYLNILSEIATTLTTSLVEVQ